MFTPLVARNRTNFIVATLYVLIATVGAVNILEVHTHHGLIAGFLYALGLGGGVWWLLFRGGSTYFPRLLASLLLWV